MPSSFTEYTFTDSAYSYAASVSSGTSLFWDTSPRGNDDVIKRYKANIREGMKRFIATGVPDEITAQMYGHKLLVSEPGIGGRGTILFMIDRRKMLVNKSPTSHMKAMLEKLAKREGLEVVYCNGINISNKHTPYVGFYPWKIRDKVDDSELMLKATVKTSTKKKDLNDYLNSLASYQLTGVPF